jgi:hypothetical protein
LRFQGPFHPGIVLLASVLFTAEAFAGESPPVAVAGLDQVSSGCLACHNGSAGSLAGFCLIAPGGKNSDGHVISAAYAGLAKRNRGIRPIGSLPPELVLHEGKITCVTCHGSDPHGSAPLAIDNRHSALCRACHLK